jgi:hypothetical protein
MPFSDMCADTESFNARPIFAFISSTGFSVLESASAVNQLPPAGVEHGAGVVSIFVLHCTWLSFRFHGQIDSGSPGRVSDRNEVNGSERALLIS